LRMMYPKLRNINLFYAIFLSLLHLSIAHLQLHIRRKSKSRLSEMWASP
jgi:hypothetical protein